MSLKTICGSWGRSECLWNCHIWNHNLEPKSVKQSCNIGFTSCDWSYVAWSHTVFTAKVGFTAVKVNHQLSTPLPPPSSVHPSIHILTLFLWSSLLSVLSSYSTAYYFKPSDLTSITTFIALPASNQKYWPFHLMICEATYTILSDTVY